MNRFYYSTALIIFMLTTLASLQAQLGDWNALPGPQDIAVERMLFSDHDAYVVYTEVGKVYISRDKGQTWNETVRTETSDLQQRESDNLLNFPERTALQSLTLSNGDQFALSSSFRLYYRYVNGPEWLPFDAGLETYEITSIAADAKLNLYVGTRDNWVFQLNHSLTSSNPFWQETNLRNVAINSMTVSEGGTLFAAGESNGVYRSLDNGENWNLINNGLSNISIYSIESTSNNKLFAGSNGAGIYYSADNGNSWATRNNGLTHLIILKLIAEGNQLYAATLDGGVFTSLDEGLNWSPFNAGMPANSTVYDILIQNNGDLLAATRFNGVYRLGDGTSIWESLGLNNIDIRSLLLSPQSDQLFAGAWYDGIFQYDVQQQRWDNSGLPSTHVMAFEATSQTPIFAATHGRGVYSSEDDGATWDALNDGLNNAGVWSLLIHDGYVFAGTSGGGIYRSIDRVATTSLSASPNTVQSFVLEQNYPNPFNPTTTIRYQLTESNDISLTLVNVVGQQIAILEQGFRNQGSYQYKLDASELPSGIYFYLLRVGNQQLAKRMVLLK